MEALHTRTALGLLLAVGGAALTAPTALAASSPAPRAGSLVIHHQTQGCHAWSFDQGRFLASQSITLARGAKLTITDADVMPHTLVELSGPRVRTAGSTIGRMGGMGMGMMGQKSPIMSVTFTHAGTYRFRTHAGEDYMTGVKTTGPDNILRLTVVVR
jgi:hypothetical protein